MAKLSIDISGRRGLVERHQGDLNDTSAQPNLRYIGEDGSFADGIFNPLKVYGYLNPANAKFASLTGTIADKITSIQYDSAGNIIYLAEEGENILQLAGLDDTSVANYLSITSTYDIKDMVLYEVNGKKALVYAIDTNTTLIEALSNSTSNTGGMYLGFKSIDTTEGATVLEKDVAAAYPTAQMYELSLVDVGSYNRGTGYGRKLAQEFDGGDVYGKAISGISISMRRSAGTGSGITIKVSIQGPASASAGAFTSRGAWVTATAYSLNDTVTASGSTFQCIQAHTSGASSQPPSGGSYEDYWNYFGAPDGVDLASQTFTLSNVPVLASGGARRYTLEFATPVTGLGTGNYWIVIEEVGSNMTASDRLAVRTTINETGIYAGYKCKLFNDAATDLWLDIGFNGGNGLDTMDFRLILNREDKWTANRGNQTPEGSLALGAFGVDTGQSTFLHLAENSLLYWFVGNKLHTVDGSITGGATGRANEDVLTFPSYLVAADVAETRSQMFIGLQSAARVTTTSTDYFKANICGVYVWDKRSTLFSTSDFYPAPGAEEIKKVFQSSTGDVKIITRGNSGFSEIRELSGGQYAVIQTFEKDGFPPHRRGVSVINGMTCWLGLNGIFYAYGAVAPGEKEQLYKIGDMSGQSSGTLASGPIFVGHKETTEPRSGILYAFLDGSTPKLQKWYPHGDGTISSVAQTGNQGNVYTKVYDFGMPTNVRWGHIYFLPISGGSSATTVATVKVYINRSSTASNTYTITAADLAKGFFYMPIAKTNVFAIQFEVEWSTSVTLGSTDFQPSSIVVDYDEAVIKKK